MGFRISPNMYGTGQIGGPIRMNEAASYGPGITSKSQIPTNTRMRRVDKSPTEKMQIEADAASRREEQATQDYRGAVGGYTRRRDEVQQPFLEAMQTETDAYRGKLDELSSQASRQATDAQQTYTNTLKPALVSNLEQAQNWQSTVRDQYAQAGQEARADLRGLMDEGSGLYGSEIEGTQRRGLADAGVLQALGSQAAASQMGGMPMTGGQMAAIMAQQSQQASEAYNTAKARMRDLEDQRRAYQLGELSRMGGVSDQYRMGGLGAQERAFGITGQAAGQLGAGQQNIQSILQSLRGEQQGYGQGGFQAGTGMAGTRYGTDLGSAQEDLGFGKQFFDIKMGQSGRDYGRNIENLMRDLEDERSSKASQLSRELGVMQSTQASQGARQDLIGSLLGTAGTIGGTMLAGPAGGAVGGQLGRTGGGAAADSMLAQRSYQPIQTTQYPLSATMAGQQGYSPYGPYAGGYGFDPNQIGNRNPYGPYAGPTMGYGNIG